MAADGRVMKAILRSILRGQYEGDAEYAPHSSFLMMVMMFLIARYTLPFIQEQLASLASAEGSPRTFPIHIQSLDVANWVEEASAIVAEAAKGDWDLKQFESVSSQVLFSHFLAFV